MFKHANMYVPGAKVRVTPESGEKLADDSHVKIASIVSANPDLNTVTVKYPDGSTSEVNVNRVEPEG